MTSARAQEIIDLGLQWANFDKFMTEQEIKEVKDYWKTLPGWTCFYDALRHISNDLIK